VSNAANAEQKGRDKHAQARNSERNDGARGIVHIGTTRMTAQMLVNELVSVLYPYHSDVQLYRPTSVVDMATNTVELMRKKSAFLKRVF
jgi:hypothetical protein